MSNTTAYYDTEVVTLVKTLFYMSYGLMFKSFLRGVSYSPNKKASVFLFAKHFRLV
jgi:hypothetical protein